MFKGFLKEKKRGPKSPEFKEKWNSKYDPYLGNYGCGVPFRVQYFILFYFYNEPLWLAHHI